jgi:hypothetical protein
MSTLSEYRERPHWSFSALNQFVNICSLQYAFQRIMRLPQAFTPVSLSFGTAFHRCCEWIQLTRRDGTMPRRNEAADLFQTLWERQTKEDQRLRFDEDQTVESCGRQGRDMIGCLVDRLDPEEEVVSVSEAFAVPLVDQWGESLETPMIGEIDTVVQKAGQKTLVDWKTSGSRWSKQKPHLDLQPTVFLYGYQHQNGETPDFRFDVIVKNKTPVLEQHQTTRTKDQFDRMVHLVRRVERMIANEAWLPSEQSFYCGGCGYQEACRAWHRQQTKTISIGGTDVRKAA